MATSNSKKSDIHVTSIKVSQLPEMLSTDISNEDLFIASDYNNGECKSKKLTFDALNASITNSDRMKDAISSNIKDAVESDKGIIKPMIENSVSSTISVMFQVLDGGNAGSFQ